MTVLSTPLAALLQFSCLTNFLDIRTIQRTSCVFVIMMHIEDNHRELRPGCTRHTFLITHNKMGYAGKRNNKLNDIYTSKFTKFFLSSHISSVLSIEKKSKYARQVACASYLLNPNFGCQLHINLINDKIIRLWMPVNGVHN